MTGEQPTNPGITLERLKEAAKKVQERTEEQDQVLETHEARFITWRKFVAIAAAAITIIISALTLFSTRTREDVAALRGEMNQRLDHIDGLVNTMLAAQLKQQPAPAPTVVMPTVQTQAPAAPARKSAR